MVPPSVVQFTNSNGTFTKCFGRNSAGICGDGVSAEATVSTTAFPLIPVFPPGTTIKTISCGYHHCLALTTDNLLYSWGMGAKGTVGSGKTVDVERPTIMDYFRDNNIAIKKICSSMRYALAISTKGNVYFWGQMFDYTGVTSYTDMFVRPGSFSVFSGGSALDIICAVEGAIVVMENGTVYAFGANNYGMLADGTSTATKTPVKATFFTKQ